MNLTQQNYAIQRIKDIAQQKRCSIPVPEKVYLTFDQKYDQIKNGVAKIKSRKGSDRFDIESIFEFQNPAEDKYKIALQQRDERVKLINKECDRICDQIRLGDSKEALKLIESFMKF